MKRIGFIGVYDKTDMLLNISKILTTMNYKILIVDSTVNQKARYIVPSISPTVSYITSYEDIDVAIGFQSLEDIKRYIGTSKLDYDFILIDTDKTEGIEKFELQESFKNYFVTSFDVYSLKKGVEIIRGSNIEVNLTKILFTREVLKEEDDYLNYLSEDCKIKWDDEKMKVKHGAQKIKLKKLSAQYKDNIGFITQQILEQKNDSGIRKIIKSIERGI